MSARRTLRKFRYYWKRIEAHFGCAVPARIRDDLVQLQYERISALIPVLYSAIALIAIVAAAATGGGFDNKYHVILPLGFLSIGIYRTIIWHRRKSPSMDTHQMRRYLRSTTFIACILGPIGGLWTLDAYYETVETRRILAPVFISMITFAGAICLISLPRAAIGVMITGLILPVIAMILSTDPGIQAMGTSLIIVTILTAGLVVTDFAQMIGNLKLRDELRRLADSDSLTGLANRRAFSAKFEKLASECRPDERIILTMIDLDGFKPVNDQYGHPAGDAVLIEVAKRLTIICKNARSIARIGGDEFAIISIFHGDLNFYVDQKESIKTVISLPYLWEGEQILISASLGIATYPEDGATLRQLMKYSDNALYREKSLAHLPGAAE